MPLNLAFVGLEGHWYAIAEELSALPQVRCVAVADDSPEMLARVPDFPGTTPETHTYLDSHDLLAKEKVDLVVEAGTDRDRAGIVLACAERGIHVITEKPLVKDLPDLEKVQAAVSRAGIAASMLITMRCLPALLALKQAVADGLIGDVCQGGAQKSYKLGERPAWQKSRETFSGIIPFVGIHAMDLMRWTSGREFVEVTAYQSNAGHPEVGDLEDNACVIARLDNGASAAFRLDYCRPAAAPTHGDDRLRLAGNRGVVECIGENTILITHGAEPRPLPLPAPVPFLADYVWALEQKRPPFIPFADCVRITEVVLRAREAADTGRPVKIPGS
jgi:predicted dehydrogenase